MMTTSLTLISLLLLLCNNNFIYYCNALSSAGRIQSRYTGHDRIPSFATVGRRVKKNISTSTQISLFQTSYYNDHAADHTMASHKSEKRRTGSRTLQISKMMGGVKDKIQFPFRNKQHTLNTDRYERYAHHGASPTTNQNRNNGRRTLQSANYFSTAARMARVQSLANNLPIIPPIRITSSRIISNAKATTALQMVLSTPDTIIEQASTQKLLDTLLDESVRTQSRQPVMMQFNPKRSWIWRQWRGTVFSETWKSGVLNMALATFVVFLYGAYPSIKDLTQGFNILWGQLLSVTTFTLTFFLNQSYGLWRKCYDYSRRLQGRLNDLGMTLAAHATRTKPSSPDIPSTYTPQSRQALELVSRYVRVFNLLTYASFTRSHRPILTPRGMRRLVERGILTPREREILTDAEIPATQRHNAVLVWLIRL